MKTLITALIVFLSLSVNGQEWKKVQDKPIRIYSNGVYKVNVPNSTKYWLFSSLDDNKRVALLVKDTLYVNKPDSIKIVEQSNELRYLKRNGRFYRYQYAFYDKSYFLTQHKKGLEIF